VWGVENWSGKKTQNPGRGEMSEGGGVGLIRAKGEATKKKLWDPCASRRKKRGEGEGRKKVENCHEPR